MKHMDNKQCQSGPAIGPHQCVQQYGCRLYASRNGSRSRLCCGRIRGRTFGWEAAGADELGAAVAEGPAAASEDGGGALLASPLSSFTEPAGSDILY